MAGSRAHGPEVEVAFLRLGGSVAELYCLSETRTDSSRVGGKGSWRLRMAGLDAPCMGPEEVEVRLL